MKYIIAGALVLLLNGCAAFKEQAGNYVTEAIIKDVQKRVEQEILASRNLTIEEIKKVADKNGDKQVTPKEVLDTVKEMSKDYAVGEAKTIIDAKIKEAEAKLVSKDNLDSKGQEMMNYLIVTFGSLVSAYLGKQIVSAKKDGKRDERIAVLEKLLQRDIDGDGQIGGDAEEQVT